MIDEATHSAAAWLLLHVKVGVRVKAMPGMALLEVSLHERSGQGGETASFDPMDDIFWKVFAKERPSLVRIREDRLEKAVVRMGGQVGIEKRVGRRGIGHGGRLIPTRKDANGALSAAIRARIHSERIWPAVSWLLAYALWYDTDLHQDSDGDGVSLISPRWGLTRFFLGTQGGARSSLALGWHLFWPLALRRVIDP